jgi:putative transposase
MDFTESQIVAILREANSAPVPEVAKKHRITEATIHAWRRKFGELGPEDVKRLRHLKTRQVLRQKLARQRADRPELARQTPATGTGEPDS